MAPAAPAADKLDDLTADEAHEADRLYISDIWARGNATKCWADHPNLLEYPLGELACNQAVETCVLGLCPTHCKEVHVGTCRR